MKLSFIIPMYNAEKYVGACLDSILESDLPKGEYEVIIINDGSKDGGPEIAQDYCAKHENFRCLTQENQGQSMARNCGLSEAQGEYVWFVDADDKISNTISDVLKELKTNDLDSLVTRMVVVDEEGHQIAPDVYFDIEYNKVLKGRDVFFSNVPIGSVCANILKKEFLLRQKLFFKAGMTQEDTELSNRLFAYAKKVKFVDLTTYVYIKHENSTTTSKKLSKRKKYILDTVDVISSLKSLSEDVSLFDKELSERILKKSDDLLFGLTLSLFRNRRDGIVTGINEAVVCKLKAEGLYPLNCRSYTLKKKLFSMILNIESLLV